MNAAPRSPAKRNGRWIVWTIAALHVLAHLLTNGRYGIFRDELYFLACADRLAWGYVDHPPLSIALLAGARGLLGDSVAAIRVLPALCGGGLVLLTAALARRMGGRRFACALAALAVTVAPAPLVMTGYYSMNALDLLFWAAALWIVVILLQGGDRRLWLALGLVCGLGLLNKLSVAFLLLGLAAGLPLSPLRRHLLGGHLWVGVTLAVALVAPHIWWQHENGWPTAEFIANARALKMVAMPPLQFLGQQALLLHPLNLPLWLVGLGALLAGHELRQFRLLALVFVVVLALLVVEQGKPYYLVPAYPPLIAAGAVWLERRVGRARWRWLCPAAVGALALGGALLAPLALPLLPPAGLARYQARLGIGPAAAERSERPAPLPQYFADRFGWRELTAAVARAYHALPPKRRARVTIVAGNYGEAAAIDRFGPAHGLPRAVSPHNNYYLWGPGPEDGELVLAVGISRARLEQSFHRVREVARAERVSWAMPGETGARVYLAEGLRLPLLQLWRRSRLFI